MSSTGESKRAINGAYLLIFFTTISLLIHTPKADNIKDSYLSHVKDACFSKGEAMSCLKYKALRIATKSLFSNENETGFYLNDGISLVPLQLDELNAYPESDILNDGKDFHSSQRGFMSEWSQLAHYGLRQFKKALLTKGLRFELPEGSKTIDFEEGEVEEGRGKRKRLAILLPLLSLLATIKTKILIIPVLLTVLFIKKLLLVAALLLPSLLSTIKACKIPHSSHNSGYHWGSSDSASEFSSSGYNAGGYTYGPGSGAYSKDWPASRAYTMPRVKQLHPSATQYLNDLNPISN